jgi:hypothetical protein
MRGPAESPPCPVCIGDATESLLVRRSVPVHQNLLFNTPEEARDVARGDLELHFCAACGFVFNAAFDSALLAYGVSYDNSQDASPAFSAHVEELVGRLASRADVRSGHVLEIGCGKGTFLRRLMDEAPDASAIGFDPSYVGPDSELDGRLRFERRFYGTDADVAADAVVARHVIEHVADPVGLLRTVAATANENPVRLFLETPSVEWILLNGVPWDFFYEHCSLFDARSLTVALDRAGFATVGVDRVFGSQYLWAEGTTSGAEASATLDRDDLDALVRTFDFAAATERVAARVRQFAEDGVTMVWGAGAKGATFCDLVDPSGSLLGGAVDLSPAKQGKHLAGTGHPILSPEQAVAHGIMTAVVLNPNYTREVAHLLAALGSDAATCDLTRGLLACG